jgi:hypothetical protein
MCNEFAVRVAKPKRNAAKIIRVAPSRVVFSTFSDFIVLLLLS